MMDALNLEDPRPMVKDLTWTMDRMMSMTRDVYMNMDSDPAATVGDRYGYVVYSPVHLDCFLAASGTRMAEENTEGVLELTADFTGEKTQTMITTINSWLHGEDNYLEDDGYDIIEGGRALFGAIAGSTVRSLRDVTYTYCVLPYPMYTADQGRYYTNLGFAYTNFCIPISAADPDMSAAVLECMSSEAYRSSSPTLFETCFKSRYSKDPESDYEMYDIIKSSIYVDANRIFSSSFKWADGAVSTFRNSLDLNKNTWMSDIGGKVNSINQILASISSSVG